MSHFVAIEALASEIPFPAASGDLCIANPVEFGVDGLGTYYVGGTGPGSPNLHGEMVSSAIRGAATDPLYAGKLDEGTSALGADYTVEVTDGSMTHVIEVVHADTNSFDLDAVNQQISDYLDGAANPNLSEATHKWVVNASFAIVPCADLATLAAYNDALLALEALLPASARKVVLLQQAILRTAEKIRVSVAAGWQACGMVLEGGFLVQPGDSPYDSCRAFIEIMQRVGVFVAAAGNTGLDYPYYPASEPSVVSVSASFENAPFIVAITDRDCAKRKIGDEPCSNAGEVLMPGVIDFNGVNYFGTSFAAPRLSLRLAVYLARYGDNVCELLDDIDPATDQPVFSNTPG
ncbi:MAG: S8/S53 family peptidase [Chloroflexi bacterium]|nr:S8/S53 family peptidase [Chloroflexota bacterium]